MPVPFLPAHRLAGLIRTRKLGCLELLNLYLKRVERYNPKLNAVVVLDAERARKRARAADRALAKGERWGPLHGVPMTIKESFDVAGLATTWGRVDLKENIAQRNALAVDRLLQAGAVLFGKTNVPTLLADWQTFNPIYGTTNDPWDLSRVPGGSSGGSAAALASGLTGLEAGSDIGASIRNPAHYCGVYGHKPTWGICSARGQALPGFVAGQDIAAVGPLARSAKDLELALKAMAGPDEIDGAGWKLDLAKPAKKSLRQYNKSQNDDIFQKNLLAARGVATGDDSYQAWMLQGNTMYHRDWLYWNEERHRMRLKWAQYFKDYDLLLCPAGATAAFPHNQTGERWERMIMVNGKPQPTTTQMFWAGYSGMAYLPSTVAPAGFTPDGLPVGVQIVGPQYGDLTCIAFAQLLEKEFHAFVAPPGYV